MPIPAPMKKNDTVWFRTSDKEYVSSEGNTRYFYREMNIERREDVRVLVDDGVYSVIDSYAPQICKIMNISSTGLSYIYFKGEEPAYESLTMDILVMGHGFCLERIPFKKVADYRADLETETGAFEKRVACIEFVDLSETQKEQIKMFITNHVKKMVN